MFYFITLVVIPQVFYIIVPFTNEVNKNDGVNKYTEIFTYVNAILEVTVLVLFTIFHVCFFVRDDKAHHFEI